MPLLSMQHWTSLLQAIVLLGGQSDNIHSSLLQHSKSGQLFAHVTLTRAGSRDRTFWNNDGRKLGGLNAPRVPVICTSLDNWGQGGRPAEARRPGLRLEERDGGELT